MYFTPNFTDCHNLNLRYSFCELLQKIRELISVLDQRKDESIERTFKGVARHFREVFSELVQGGHGHLVMMKKKVCQYLSSSFCFFTKCITVLVNGLEKKINECVVFSVLSGNRLCLVLLSDNQRHRLELGCASQVELNLK